MTARFFVVLGCCWLAIGAACGRTELELSSGSGGTHGSGGHDGGHDGGQDGGQDGPIDARVDRGGTGGAVATGSGGRAGGTGGVIGTGGAPLPRDAGAPDVRVVDGGPVLPPSTPGTLQCGNQTCMTRTQSCCVNFPVGTACVPIGSACSGVALGCDEPADCTGGVCCFGLQTGPVGGIPVGSACSPRATCAGLGRFVVCRQNSDCAGGTPFCCNSVFGAALCQAARCPGG